MIAQTTPIEVAQPGTDAWYAARSSGIGASEIAAAAGLSHYATPLEIYSRKKGLIPEGIDNKATRLGRRLEPVVIAEYVDETGDTLEAAPCPMFRHPAHPFVLATPDGLIVADGQPGTLEAKTTTFRMLPAWGDTNSDQVPDEYLIQTQIQMAVTGRPFGKLACLVDGRNLRVYRIERNDELIRLLIDAARELWQRIQNDDPPEPNWEHPSTPALVRELYGTVNDSRIELSADAVAWWDRYESLGKEAGEIQAERDALKARVLMEIGENFAGVLGDGRMVRRKLTTRKAYTVEDTTYVDVRAVKYDGRPVLSRPAALAIAASK